VSAKRKPEELVGLSALLAFANGRTVDRELSWAEANKHLRQYGNLSGVRFTDGAEILVAIDYGFTGSEVTPPDTPEVRYFGISGEPA